MAVQAQNKLYRKAWMNNARREEIHGWLFAMPEPDNRPT